MGKTIATGSTNIAGDIAKGLIQSSIFDAQRGRSRRYDVLTVGGTANLAYRNLEVAGGFATTTHDGQRVSFILGDESAGKLLELAAILGGSSERVVVSVSVRGGEVRYRLLEDDCSPWFDAATSAEKDFPPREDD